MTADSGESRPTWGSGPWGRQDWIYIHLGCCSGDGRMDSPCRAGHFTTLSTHIPATIASQHWEQPVQRWPRQSQLHALDILSSGPAQPQGSSIPCGSSSGPADTQGSGEPVSSLEVMMGMRLLDPPGILPRRL